VYFSDERGPLVSGPLGPKRVPLQEIPRLCSEAGLEPRSSVLHRHGLPAATENTITDRDELREELEQIRDRGYAIDNEERIEGIRYVATSISNEGGVAGAVSVSAPRSRLNSERFKETLPSAVRSTANIVKVNLQHS